MDKLENLKNYEDYVYIIYFKNKALNVENIHSITKNLNVARAYCKKYSNLRIR